MRYWLAIDPGPGGFTGWTVESAERCMIEEIDADSAIELLGALGSSKAKAALGRLSVKPASVLQEAASRDAARPAVTQANVSHARADVAQALLDRARRSRERGDLAEARRDYRAAVDEGQAIRRARPPMNSPT